MYKTYSDPYRTSKLILTQTPVPSSPPITEESSAVTIGEKSVNASKIPRCDLLLLCPEKKY